MAVHALTGFSLVSLLSFGYLSWDWMKPSLVADVATDPMEKSPPPTFTRPPHIIFILTDDQGYHDIGYHGSDIQTPTLDRLAAEGVKLENYYIQPICTPSRSQLITGSPKEPIFIYVAFQAVHTPLQSPKEYIYRYRSMGNVARRKYAAMVTCMDEAVKNITWALKKYGYYDNSVIRKRRTSWALVHITDWYPTLVSLARGNLSNVQGLDGYDVWPAISEGKESPRTEILHNIDPLYNHAKYGSLEDGFGIWNTAVQASIRVGEWKLLTGDPGYSDWIPPQTLTNFPGSWWNLERLTDGPRKSVWLFNITADPYERYDLSEQRPDVVRSLLLRLVHYNRTAIPVRYPAENPRAHPDFNGGAWGPWATEDEEEEWEGGRESLKGRNKKKKKKCKICKLRSFFRKLNTRLMSNRI
ncbi:hypothetical protein EK904_004317 [Melospiza melodia maxima]|nr:hypothetical protein EK904_004317 [Melospiza melodia maxima]